MVTEALGRGNDRARACTAGREHARSRAPGVAGAWSRMMKASPLAQVKARFESKDKLIEAVRQLATDELWIDRVDEDKGLERVSNKKLLHLHEVLTHVKEQFGSRAKLIDAICDIEKRTKDEGYKSRLERFPTPRLLDYYRAAVKRAG